MKGVREGVRERYAIWVEIERERQKHAMVDGRV